MKDVGFIEEEIIHMLQRNFAGRDTPEKMKKMVEKGMNFIQTDGKWVKWEPTYVFRKKNG